MTDQFQQKAQRLMSKLSSLQPSQSIIQSRKIQPPLQPKPSVTSSASYSISDLHKFQEQVEVADDQNKRKIKVLHDEMSKLQTYLLDQNEARNKISDNFVSTAGKVQKNMKLTLDNLGKSFEQKQRKLQQKIEQILLCQKKQLQSQLSQNQNLMSQITSLSKHLSALQQQLQQIKRSRYQLQDKIYKQFIEQIKQLRKIYERDLKERQERENQLVQCLKSVYTSLMEHIRREEQERELNQKGFLTVVEQIINSIVEY